MSTDERREQILQVALTTFGQYGYRRTTMGDLADAAGISRPALYLVFRNKEDIFRSCAEWLQEQSCRAAEQTLSEDGPFAARIAAAIHERFALLYDSVRQLPHAAELLDLNSTIAPDITLQMETRARDLLARAAADADAQGEIDLRRVGLSPEDWAALLLSGLHGLKSGLSPEEPLADRALDLVRVFCVAVTPAG